jgi:sulfhydrogenase subunit delta
VDLELRGCPIDRRQLLDTLTALLTALLTGRRPNLPLHSVCFECKARGTTCVLVANRTPCLGPVTAAGCGALCPAYGRGCYGCFGPAATVNVPALTVQLRATGMDDEAIKRVFATFNVAAFHEVIS